MYSVYILYSQKIDRFYIGFSSDVHQRLLKHNRVSKGFSNTGKPWILVYQEVFQNKKEAMNRERQLKKWKNRERLLNLINNGSEHPYFQSGGSVPRMRDQPPRKLKPCIAS
jgi:putative endonuclease